MLTDLVLPLGERTPNGSTTVVSRVELDSVTKLLSVSKFSEVAPNRTQFAQAQNEHHEMAKVSKEMVEMKLQQLRKSVDLKTVNEIDLIDGYISKMENLLNDYTEVSAKFRVLFKDVYNEIYKDDFAKYINGVSHDFKEAGVVRQKIKDSL